MSGAQARTLALFAAVILGVGYLDSRVAWGILGAVGFVLMGRWIVNKQPKLGG